MNAKYASLRLAFFLSGAAALALSLPACFRGTSEHICSQIEKLPLSPASTPPATVVIEDPGTIKVMHGSACAHVDRGPFVKVEQNTDLPDYANEAAVFLNGWKVRYSGGDHHVAAIATVLGNIKVEPQKLTWQAVGALTDDGFDKAIDWCYSYTVIAWNNVNLQAFVDQSDAGSFCRSGGTPSGSDKFFFADDNGVTTALSSFPTFLANPNFASGRTVAVLPRGFGFNWGHLLAVQERATVTLFSPRVDHHLLQIAYNLGHSETFIQNQSYKKAIGELNPLPTPPEGRVGSDFVSWNVAAIFKDNDTRRDYDFGEFVSGMGGPDVAIIEPPFSILPREDIGFFGACVENAPVGIKTENVAVDNIPYAYAIPMLTGWQLAYGCHDHHVREAGVSIDNFQYARDANAPSGTLRYTLPSILRDDSRHGHAVQHKVTILGLRPLPATPGSVIR